MHHASFPALNFSQDASKHKAIPYYKMPGAEFKVAYEEVRKCGGKVAYGIGLSRLDEFCFEVC